MLKKGAREPYKEIGVAQCFQGLRRFCFQTREVCTALNAAFGLGLDRKYYQPKELNKKLKKIF